MMAPPKFPNYRPHSRVTPMFPAPPHLSPFSPPDCNRSHYFSCLTAFPLFLHSLVFIISNCLCLLFGTQGKPGRLKPFSINTEMGNTEGAFVPRRARRNLLCFSTSFSLILLNLEGQRSKQTPSAGFASVHAPLGSLNWVREESDQGRVIGQF